jgi:broad specificity phosphatase PhoE
MPEFGPRVPPERWQLSAEGWRGADSLRRVLPAAALLVASEEPKARQTLEPTGEVLTDRRFNEVWRDEPFDDDFRTRRRAYVTGTDHPGWEPRDEAVARFGAGVRHWRAQAAARPLVIASHGMAMTLWLAAEVGLDDAGAFWTDLRFPDVFTVDVATKAVSRRSAGP